MMIQKISDQIIKAPLQPLNLKRVDSIALHHMAHPTADVKTVESWHINQGWRAFGYNFWVAFDGTVYEGRGFNAGVDIIKYVSERVPAIKNVGGHKDYMVTACPGRYFPLKEMKTLQKRGKKVNYYDTLEQCPEWARPYVKKAIDNKYIIGDEQGKLRLTDDRIWTLVVGMRINGIMA